MIISRIEIENFRNFKEKSIIDCSINGKVTIVYGKNGDGKTTFHQFFKWLFYGKDAIHFNKTTSNKLYNLELENEKAYGDIFSVKGIIEFLHEEINYSLTREELYKKELNDSKSIKQHFSLLKKDNDNNWVGVASPEEAIENMLPTGLSEYFFFDGETMVADLKTMGKDSAKKLRKALYSIFDLNIYENALNHLGRTDLKTTVLGKLYLSKANLNSSNESQKTKRIIKNIQSKIEEIDENIEKLQADQTREQEIIKQVYEKIGKNKTGEQYNKERNDFIEQRDRYLTLIKTYQHDYGTKIELIYPAILVSKAVRDTQKKIKLKVDETDLIPGLNRKIVEHVLEKNKCICGDILADETRTKFEELRQLLPPYSYKSMYDDFKRDTQKYANDYDEKLFNSFIIDVLQCREESRNFDKKIKDLDEEQRQSIDDNHLVDERSTAEINIEKINVELSKFRLDRLKWEELKKQQMREFNKQVSNEKNNQIVQKKIEIINKVQLQFQSELENKSKKYSKELQLQIDDLLKKMLTTKRNVEVSNEFSIRIFDSYNDESKSEGQFAVVSFAYIGGIFKLLKDNYLSNKEYPLVLDGPFSKLDEDQKKNVIETIPQYAPQVIIFSKDDLHNYFNEDSIGNVWTIESNDEKNVAYIKEGHLWK